jgi:hypothetical protein
MGEIDGNLKNEFVLNAEPFVFHSPENSGCKKSPQRKILAGILGETY